MEKSQCSRYMVSSRSVCRGLLLNPSSSRHSSDMPGGPAGHGGKAAKSVGCDARQVLRSRCVAELGDGVKAGSDLLPDWRCIFLTEGPNPKRQSLP